MRDLPAPPEVLLLYWTLVRDGVLPGGHESQFASLEHAILKGATAGSDNLSWIGQPGSDNLTSAVWLHQRCAQKKEKQRSERLRQFLSAALDRPSKFRARWEEKYYDGHNARRDA